QPGLRAGYHQPKVEPRVPGDIDRRGEPGPAVELPVATTVEHRRVLHGIGISGPVLPEIHLLGVEAIADDPEHEPEESAGRRRGSVYVDHAVRHFEILD